MRDGPEAAPDGPRAVARVTAEAEVAPGEGWASVARAWVVAVASGKAWGWASQTGQAVRRAEDPSR